MGTKSAAPVAASPHAASDAPAAVWVDIGTLTPWTKNPRKNQGRPVQTVADLIRTLGWGRTLGAWRGRLVWGHTARLAALSLIERWRAMTAAERKVARESDDPKKRWSPDAIRTAETSLVPVRHRDDLSEREANKMAIADNRSNELAGWDNEPLQEILGDYDLPEIEEMGWTSDEIDKMAADALKGSGGGDGDGDDDMLGDNGFEYSSQYAVIVTTSSEQEQEAAYNRLTGLGYKCKVVSV